MQTHLQPSDGDGVMFWIHRSPHDVIHPPDTHTQQRCQDSQPSNRHKHPGSPFKINQEAHPSSYLDAQSQFEIEKVVLFTHHHVTCKHKDLYQFDEITFVPDDWCLEEVWRSC